MVERSCYTAQKRVEITPTLTAPRTEGLSKQRSMQRPFLCTFLAAPPFASIIRTVSEVCYSQWALWCSALRQCSGPHLLLPFLQLNYFLCNDSKEAFGTLRNTGVFNEMMLLVVSIIEEPRQWQEQCMEGTHGAWTGMKQGKRRHMTSHRISQWARKAMVSCQQ